MTKHEERGKGERREGERREGEREARLTVNPRTNSKVILTGICLHYTHRAITQS